MDQVFAPWRIDWVEREDRNAEFDDCVLCELPAAGADREHRVLARTGRAYVLLNNYPYSPGHVMVVPHTHTGDLRDLDEETTLAMARLRNRLLDALEDSMGPDGFNVGLNLGGGAAGGSIDDHVHTHVVPRWEGDTNFMPVLSDTQVIVEALEDTYDRLHEALAAQDGATAPGDDAAVEF
jgi:ATP adenylyltransferase